MAYRSIQKMNDPNSFEWNEPQTPEQIMDEAIKKYSLDKLYVLFSGGKDSSCVAHYIATNYPDKFGGVVFTNTGLGAQDTRKFVLDYCKKMGWRLWFTWSDKRKTFKDVLLERGWAAPQTHRTWMGYLKFHSWYYFGSDRLKKGEKMAFISGVRKKESRARQYAKKYTKTPVDHYGKVVFIKPFLFKNGEQLWNYFYEFGLEKSKVYEWLNRSGECHCGAHAQAWDLQLIKQYDPLTFETIQYYEKQIELYGTDVAKKYHKWGGHSKLTTEDIQKQSSLDTFTDGDQVIKVSDDYCGESCMVEEGQ